MVSTAEFPRLPTIDLSLFELGDPWRDQVAAQIDAASSEFGCFCLVGHEIDGGVVAPLIAAGRAFFATEGAAQRPDRRATQSRESQRLYFEEQRMAGDELLQAATSLGGENCSPQTWDFREPVLEHVRSLAGLSHKIMAMVARGLHLPDSFFVDRYTGSPSLSFQIVQHAPKSETCAPQGNFAAERTDSRFLTLLRQEAGEDLEFKHRGAWLTAPDMPQSLLCSVGSGLERLTSGRYVTAPQRIINGSDSHRLSVSFGFGPAPGVLLEPIATRAPASLGLAPLDAHPRNARRQLA